jgi:hypothetical protein
VNWPGCPRARSSAARSAQISLRGPCRAGGGAAAPRGADGTSIITGSRSPRSRADHQPAGLRPRAHPRPATGGAHHPRRSTSKRHPGQHGRGLLRRTPPSARAPARTTAQDPGRVPDHRGGAGGTLAGRAEPGPACAGLSCRTARQVRQIAARQVRQIRASARSSLVPVPVLSARTRSAAPARNPVVTSRSASPSSRSVPSSMSLPGTSTSPSV